VGIHHGGCRGGRGGGGEAAVPLPRPLATDGRWAGPEGAEPSGGGRTHDEEEDGRVRTRADGDVGRKTKLPDHTLPIA
jgi:hypothetical protein